MMYGYAWDTSTPLTFALSILPILGHGLLVTLQAAAVGYAIALVLGLVLALLRRSRIKAISWTVACFTEFVRDTPLLVQLFFLYYVLPDFGIILPAFMTGALALGLQYSAYTSEVYRGGINAVSRGQWEAATALNMTRLQTYRDPADDSPHRARARKLSCLDAEGDPGPLRRDRARHARPCQHDRRADFRISSASLHGRADLPSHDPYLLGSHLCG
jgi:His/Glu/Gln/Arg/opine family amino acid ABC transporter permease subunit